MFVCVHACFQRDILYISHLAVSSSCPHTHMQISVVEATTGLPKEYCHYVFCQYRFWNQEEPMIIPPLVQSITEKLADGVQKFEHYQVQPHFWTTLLQSMTPGLLWQTAELHHYSVDIWLHKLGVKSISALLLSCCGQPSTFTCTHTHSLT